MKLTDITLDTELQSRVEINEEAINDYSEALREGAKFPAITVFRVGSSYYLADGWHRYYAHKKAGLALIEAIVIDGTYRQAKLFSYGANDTNGLRKTSADKRKAVLAMLDDVEWVEWNDTAIAKECKVSATTVARIRKELGIKLDAVKVERNGKEFSMKKPDNQVKTKVEPKLEYEFDDKEEKIHELATEIHAMAEENEALRARVAVAAMEATDEERQEAETIIGELQTKNKALESEVVHYKARVHSLMKENGELKTQIKRQDKQIYAMQKKAA